MRPQIPIVNKINIMNMKIMKKVRKSKYIDLNLKRIQRKKKCKIIVKIK